MANESNNCTDSAKSDTKADAAKVSYKMTGPAKQLHDSIGSGAISEVRRLLSEGVPVDSEDEHGMTPLQHAAYKGNRELCDLLLSHGADVNTNSHEHGYTTLMFGALSGKKDVVRVLLEHGACVGLENSVHKTASQMAAFIGQHEIVSLINNYFSREDLEYYCQPRGLDTEPKLPPALSPSLYKFILTVNLNPVKLSLVLRQNIELLINCDRVSRVLDLLCEKMMKQRDTNEILALKFSYFSYVLKQAAKSHQQQQHQQEQQSASEDAAPLGMWIKHLLKVDSDGVHVNQDRLVQSMLREFPYVECQLMHQIVRTITSSVANVSALNVLTSCINGQRFATADDKMCSTCGDLNAKTCQVCKSVFYCNRECQKLDWFVHKKQCKMLAAAATQSEQLQLQEKAVDENVETEEQLCKEETSDGQNEDRSQQNTDT